MGTVETGTARKAIHINGHAFEARDEIHGRKLEALRLFALRLLGSPAREQIAKIILFGSVARGEATEESDIDVMVYGFGNLEALRDEVYEATDAAWSATQESIEPIIEDGYELLEPDNYFTYSVLQFGKEAYSMNAQYLRREQVSALLELAREYLESAQHAFDGGRWRAAADLAYNAAELCIKGFLYLKLEVIPSSHSGLKDKFTELYCKNGPFPREVGRRVKQALEVRSKARYDAKAEITADKAQHNLALASELITALEDFLMSQGNEQKDNS